MLDSKYQILLYYKYVRIEDPQQLMIDQRKLCENIGLVGRIIIAKEGINGTVEGTYAQTKEYINTMKNDPKFASMQFKTNEGTGSAFPKLSVKVRKEIVSSHLGESDFDPNEVTGKYIEPEQLHSWFEEGKEFYIVDMRSDYEQKVGYFEDSILSDFENFRDLPKIIPQIKHLQDKPVITVCTGGIKCEKASGFLVNNGFNDVYQLHGGIHKYMEAYPNKHFKGKLYVFDDRVVMSYNSDSPEHEIVSKCEKCDKENDNYVDCAYIHCIGHRHFICCTDCYADDGKPYCSKKCHTKAKEDLSKSR